MQREIKFRAWDSNDECMVYQEDVGEDFDFQVYPNHLKLLVNEQHHECGSGVAQEYWKYVEREAVFMQFTGLKDKSGAGLIELYEGDIISRDGKLIGNIYEDNKRKADLIIPKLGTKAWEAAYKEAVARGFDYSE